ncbi:prepilin cleavage protein [Citrobacter sp. VF227]
MELILVLSVGSMMAFIKFQDMKTNQENMMADSVSNQIKQIGEAANRYISIHYDKLSTLSSSSSQSSDPGPRTCSANGCEITYQTLINEGLLPSTYTGINAQKSSYKILLKRSGASPNYVINGLLTTTAPWIEGNNTRYDLLGKAMQVAGIDSGMTQSATSASGYNGLWSEKLSDFPSINSAGLLAYRVGYDSSMYSVYLRRDGTLPMTGDLNMGGKSINNALNIDASGLVSTNTLQTAGSVSVGGDFSVAGKSNLKGTVNIQGNTNISAPLYVSGDVVGNKIHANANLEGQNLALVYGATMGSSLMVGNFTVANDQAGWIQASGDIKSVNGDLYGNKLHIKNVKTAGSSCTGVNEGVGTYVRDSNGFILSCINGLWRKGTDLPVGSPILGLQRHHLKDGWLVMGRLLIRVHIQCWLRLTLLDTYLI